MYYALILLILSSIDLFKLRLVFFTSSHPEDSYLPKTSLNFPNFDY